MRSAKVGNGGSVNDDDADVEMVAVKSNDVEGSLHADLDDDIGRRNDDATSGNGTSDVGARGVAAGHVRDTGYSWVVLGAVLANYCLVAIGLGATGVLYPHFVEHFHCTMYEAGWIGSLNMAVGALVGNMNDCL